MSIALLWYLKTNLLLAVAWLVFCGVRGLASLFPRAPALSSLSALSQGLWLVLGRSTLVAALVASLVAALLPAPRPFDATARLWAQPAIAPSAAPAGVSDEPVAHRPSARDASRAWDYEIIAWALLGLAAAVRAGRLAAEGRRLGSLMRRTLPCRRIGRVDVRVSDEVAVPFSWRSPTRAYVVLPGDMMGSAEDIGIALRHEGQHHRNGDTIWTLGLEALPVLFPVTPFAAAWRRTLSHLQEFACDEALIGRGRVDSQAYGHCLIRVTEAALVRDRPLVGTASMAAKGKDPGHTQCLLERRLSMLQRYKLLSPPTRRLGVALGAAVLALSVSAAHAANGIRPRDPLTREQVQRLVDAMDVTPGFDLTVNDRVVANINKVVTDPERCARMRAALGRMADLQPALDQALARYGHPKELLAVPLVESMYQNLPANSRAPHSAGVWQFVPQTARNYGLVVTDAVDQRLDIPLETDAAMRYLGANDLRFSDWLLALAGYNQGEGFVQRAVDASGTRDAWALVENGRLNDYLVLVTAGAILIANPDLVE